MQMIVRVGLFVINLYYSLCFLFIIDVFILLLSYHCKPHIVSERGIVLFVLSTRNYKLQIV